GTVVGTRNGMKGDRELLFVGGAANHAAKTVGPTGCLRVTERIFDALPDNLRELCNEVRGAEGVYQIGRVDHNELDQLLEDWDDRWNRDHSQLHLAEDRRQFPLKEIAYGSADVIIDPDALSIRNSKLVLAASIFGDITGFTDYIDSTQSYDELIKAI